MHPKCLYATDNPQNWEIHMAKHIDMIDVLDKRLNMDKEIRSTHIKYRECPYCQYEAKANFQTIAHMEQTHCRSAFQCEHCFYRSIEMDNMISHYEMHHKDKSRKILLCNDEVEFQQSDEEQLKSYCDQNVEKIKCGQGKKNFSHSHDEFFFFSNNLFIEFCFQKLAVRNSFVSIRFIYI